MDHNSWLPWMVDLERFYCTSNSTYPAAIHPDTLTMMTLRRLPVQRDKLQIWFCVSVYDGQLALLPPFILSVCSSFRSEIKLRSTLINKTNEGRLRLMKCFTNGSSVSVTLWHSRGLTVTAVNCRQSCGALHLISWFFNWLTDWLTDRLTDWLTDWQRDR